MPALGKSQGSLRPKDAGDDHQDQRQRQRFNCSRSCKFNHINYSSAYSSLHFIQVGY